LGADLERNHDDEEAIGILEPVFERTPGNTRAALGIIRVLLRQDKLPRAEGVLRRAKRNTMLSGEPFLVTAEAEILLASKRPGVAVELLKRETIRNPTHVGLLLEAFAQAAEESERPNDRDKLFSEGLAVTVPERWKFNVPIQVNRARLAVKAGNEHLFNDAIQNLAGTRIDPQEVERLRQHWIERN
jgi:predicted Zn-dependent protease